MLRRLGRGLLLAAAALLITAGSTAYAAGRAGARVEVRTDGAFSIRTYAEEVVFRFLDLEVAAGMDYRHPENTITPYTAFNWYADGWWASVELAGDIPLEGGGIGGGAFKVTLAAGVYW